VPGVPERVEGEMAASVALVANDEAACRARVCLRAFLDGVRSRSELTEWLATPYVVGDAEVVVSELVTNAVEHGRSPVHMRLGLEGGGLRIEVADASAVVPHLPPPDLQRETGRGLRLVAALSRTWGTTSTDEGKFVWAIMGGTAGGSW